MDIVQEICIQTNRSWGVDVLMYDHEMNVTLSKTFIIMFSGMFSDFKENHLHFDMGLDENGKCFTHAHVSFTNSGTVTLTLHAPSFAHTFTQTSVSRSPHKPVVTV